MRPYRAAPSRMRDGTAANSSNALPPALARVSVRSGSFSVGGPHRRANSATGKNLWENRTPHGTRINAAMTRICGSNTHPLIFVKPCRLVWLQF